MANKETELQSTREPTQEDLLWSIAVSTKRIADVLELLVRHDEDGQAYIVPIPNS